MSRKLIRAFSADFLNLLEDLRQEGHGE